MPIGQIIADRPPHRTVRAHLRIRLPWMSGEESQDLRLRQQPLRRVWAGNRQAVLGRVEEEEVVDCSSVPLPQILAENPRWKRKWMKVANEPLASSPQSLRAGNLPRWKANLHQRERWRFETVLIWPWK